MGAHARWCVSVHSWRAATAAVAALRSVRRSLVGLSLVLARQRLLCVRVDDVSYSI